MLSSSTFLWNDADDDDEHENILIMRQHRFLKKTSLSLSILNKLTKLNTLKVKQDADGRVSESKIKE